MFVYVLHARCGCSIDILDRLLTEPRPRDVEEVVVLSGVDSILAERLRARGIRVVSVSRRWLRRYFSVEALPAFAVLSPSNAVTYLGGYRRPGQAEPFAGRIRKALSDAGKKPDGSVWALTDGRSGH